MASLFDLSGGCRAVWPALGGGLGLVAHAVSVFQLFPFFGGDWERREVERYLGRRL